MGQMPRVFPRNAGYTLRHGKTYFETPKKKPSDETMPLHSVPKDDQPYTSSQSVNRLGNYGCICHSLIPNKKTATKNLLFQIRLLSVVVPQQTVLSQQRNNMF